MGVRRYLVHEAEQRARRQVTDAVRELRTARITAGLSQASVAHAIGVARQLISAWERAVVLPDQIQLARYGAAVGRDVTLRVYLGGSPLHDAGHVRLLDRTRRLLGQHWR